MKDTNHHRRYVQKKVIQSLRKELEKSNNTVVDGEGLKNPLVQMPGTKSEKLIAKRR